MKFSEVKVGDKLTYFQGEDEFEVLWLYPQTKSVVMIGGGYPFVETQLLNNYNKVTPKWELHEKYEAYGTTFECVKVADNGDAFLLWQTDNLKDWSIKKLGVQYLVAGTYKKVVND